MLTLISQSVHKTSSSIEELQSYGVEFNGGLAIVYRGTDVPNQIQEDLRYGDFLSAAESGTDFTGNLAADSYGKHVYRFEIKPEYLKVTNGELQYVGPTYSIQAGKYPEAIYRAYNDSQGSNYTSTEIDQMPFEEVRMNASMALSGGREEFEQLLGSHSRN